MKHGSGICFSREGRPFQNPLSCQVRHLASNSFSASARLPEQRASPLTRVVIGLIGFWPLALGPWLNSNRRLCPTLIAAIKVGFNHQVICQKLRLQGMAPTSFAADEVALST